ncbi:MAG TPA: CRISPR-associated endoribonuclease Cas6, partial [Bacteroidales bacterium]|nr:CRISPR-associated endoribonuclease Cas6 [Bacteroidales bacterium]
MKFKLTLELTGKDRQIPINYQYEQSAWIYKTIHNGNPEFSAWLHNSGYLDGNKQFKLFTFSPIVPEKYAIKHDRLEIQSNHAVTHVSFYTPEAAEPFILGLFNNQHFMLGDHISQTQFKIHSIEKLPEPQWNDTMIFRTLSPIVLSKKQEGSKNARYLAPGEEDFEDLFLKNLENKFKVIDNNPDRVPDSGRVKLTPRSTPRSKLIKNKGRDTT